MHYEFDLISDPARIQPAYAFYAIFVGAGVVLGGLAIAAVLRRWSRLYALTLFAPVWIALSSTLIFLDARDVMQIRELVERKQYSFVEGCLDTFHPGLTYGTKSTAGNERWSLGGQQFDYGAGEVRPGYKRVEARGGLIHANTKVRVFFVVSPYYGRNEIVGLQVLGSSCPRAFDPSQPLK